MTPSEKAEYVELCIRHLTHGDVPTTPQGYAAWKQEMRSGQTSDEEADSAWFQLYSLSQTAPADAWDILRDLTRRTTRAGDLTEIGAGVLERFVSTNGWQFVDEIEYEIRSNPSFVVAMKMVNGIERIPGLDKRVGHLLRW